MDIFLMSIQEDVLRLFRDEISRELDSNGKEILLELDSDLYDTPGDDLHSALDRFEKEFRVDLSDVDWSRYFPWENTPLLTRWFKAKRDEVEQTRQALTVRMFAESAEAGKWLYD
ncbi:DUF1493 family protein [Pantoea sp. FN060301]|uniref:DUF1493 family protein n=1 Tax=Pantoea sp. FN060301 TaxID=3420380 RepID=UPI003D16D632